MQTRRRTTADESLAKLYRTTPVGCSLKASLDEMLAEGKITDQKVKEIWTMYDESLVEAISVTKSSCKEIGLPTATLRGAVGTYNLFKGEWCLNTSVTAEMGAETLKVDALRMEFPHDPSRKSAEDV